MTLSDVHRLFAYTAWANERMFDALAKLDAEAFIRPLGSSFPTIRDTAAHIVAGEWVWLSRWTGTSPSTWPEWLNDPPLDDIVARWRILHDERSVWLGTLSDAALLEPLSFRRLNGEAAAIPLGYLLQHVVNHSTYHRGQVATMLRQVGVVPPSTDLLYFPG